MRLSENRSIVAIDPTSRSIAFVCFENGAVLDWGERMRARDSDDVSRITDGLIERCAADVLILENPEAKACKRRPRIRKLLLRIAEHARSRKVRVIAVARADVRRAWAARGVMNKVAIAAEIARRFPELAGVLPPRRKRGANEDPRVNIFDAASLVLRYDETLPAELLP